MARTLRVLGGASYAIYLFQFVFIGLVWKVWLATPAAGNGAAWVLYVLLVGAALGGGIVTSRLVEKPLLRLARGPVRSSETR